MTKVSKIMVKCAKCGNESEQLFVYSVNFNLGNRESNEKLMRHKQKCPYCGYEEKYISINNKNEIKIEENVPQMVSEISNFQEPVVIPNTLQTSFENNKEKVIAFKILNEKSDYLLMLKQGDDYANISFVDRNNLSNTLISNVMKKIPYEKFDELLDKLCDMTKDWKAEYTGNSGITWKLNITTNNINKTFMGNGGYPKNWNSYIDLISEYEILYKSKI